MNSFNVFTDVRGSLAVTETRTLPFSPKRIYFLFNTKKKRGGHAHRREKEIFVCVAGSFRARIHDGRRWRSIAMKKPGQALYCDAMVWHEFDRFSPGAVMLALSSTFFAGRKGYIMDFEEFLTCHKKYS